MGREGTCQGLTNNQLELNQKQELEEPQLQPSGSSEGLTMDHSQHFPPGRLSSGSVPRVIRPSPVPTSM